MFRRLLDRFRGRRQPTNDVTTEAAPDLASVLRELRTINKGLRRLVVLAEQADTEKRVALEWQYMVDKYGPEIGAQVEVPSSGDSALVGEVRRLCGVVESFARDGRDVSRRGVANDERNRRRD